VTTVSTTAGLVRGLETDGVIAFRGIPYAQADRFRPPHAPQPWDGVRDALEFGPIAPQAPGAQFQRADLAQDEDCLSLNIWTGSVAGRAPVMVWIHGGGFRSGSGASPLYEGSQLARAGAVVVTINYRLGALGFLAHPEFGGGNWGLHDQIESLRWVRDNIAAFGGDPSNVTIFGESAGAVSVWQLVRSPLAQGLFVRAIAQSGGPLSIPFESASRRAEKAAEVLGVASVADITSASVSDLLQLETTLDRGRMDTFVPTLDGVVLDGKDLAAEVPMIMGTNVDEWKLWAPMDPHSRDLDEDQLLRRVTDRIGDRAADAIAGVRAARTDRGEPAQPNDLFFAIETERFFRVPAIRATDARLSVQPETYVYLFGWSSPAMGGWLGACHGLEIAFAFGTHGRGDIAAFTGSGPEADALSHTMMQRWLAFARTGDPGWPRYDTHSRPTMVFDRTSEVRDAPRDEERVVVDRAMV